jgi:hypothetical protein
LLPGSRVTVLRGRAPDPTFLQVAAGIGVRFPSLELLHRSRPLARPASTGSTEPGSAGGALARPPDHVFTGPPDSALHRAAYAAASRAPGTARMGPSTDGTSRATGSSTGRRHRRVFPVAATVRSPAKARSSTGLPSDRPAELTRAWTEWPPRVAAGRSASFSRQSRSRIRRGVTRHHPRPVPR